MPTYNRPKFKTKTEKSEVRAVVARMDREGFTQVEIGKELGISQPMVSNYLGMIREAYRQTILSSQAEYVQEKLEQYRDLRKECWLAYRRSMEDHEKRVEEFSRLNMDDSSKKKPKKPMPKPSRKGNKPGSVEDKLERFKVVVTKDGRLPAVEYLKVIAMTYEAERNLLGLDAQPKKGDVNVNIGTQHDWHGVLCALAAAEEEGRDYNLLPNTTPKITVETPPPTTPVHQQMLDALNEMNGESHVNGDGT